MRDQASFINQLNLKLIHTFLLVAEHQSFREAALRAGRSQSAISMQIKQVEQQLGVPLIVRTTRRLKLTAEGELLLEHARRAMREMEHGLRHLTEIVELRRGKVTVACSPVPAATTLPPILARFKKENPGVQIRLLEHKSAQIYDAVRSGEADFGIGPEANDETLQSRLIESEPLLALVPRSLIPEDRREITFAELATLPLIQFYPNTVLARLVSNVAAAQNLQLDTQFLCIQGQTLVSLAEAGLGASILTESVADLSAIQHSQKLLITEPKLHRNFALILLRNQPLSPAAQRLFDLILEEGLGHADNGSE